MKIESFEAACQARGYDPVAILPDVSGQPEWLQKYTVSTVKRVIIAEAINEGRVRKIGEWIYSPVWRLTNDGWGFGLSRTDYGDLFTLTFVGSRLEFFSRQDSDFFGSNFMDLHRDVLISGPGR